MTHLHKAISIDAAPEAVWEILGDLAATSEWNPGTITARMEGSLRICDMADGKEIQEEISDYSSEHRTYRFRHQRIPLPVKSSTGTFAVHAAAGGGALVVLDCDFEALDPALEADIERMLGNALERALESLRRRVERGVSWQAA
ncbi:MAG: SRPBCC family protein [Actinomycetota bacterium]|nr:SRPBCC family protein [Actinomycetota bacterium]